MSIKKKQSGVVLAVSLIMLLLLTLIGLSGTQVTSLEEKMAGNARDQNIAFQAAESTLVAAENYIDSLLQANINSTFSGSGGLLPLFIDANTDGIDDNPEPDFFDSATWDPSANPLLSRNTPDGFSGNLGLTANPRYIIKRIQQIPPPTPGDPVVNFFRITARAKGRVEGTQVILQSIYVRTN